jgi:hypothetical protein
MIERYTKKPVSIEATQWDGTIADGRRIIDWIDDHGHVVRWTNHTPQLLRIETLEGNMDARPGDWIIRGVAGEFYPCKPEIFAQTYDKAGG